MTGAEIRAAIAASPELLALLHADPPDHEAVAAELRRTVSVAVPTEIGSGTILAQLGAAGMSGGQFLDALETVGQTDRDVYWTMDLIRQGRLRIELPATRAGLQRLATAVPTMAPAMAELLKLGTAPAQVTEFDVRAAVYADDGTLKV